MLKGFVAGSGSKNQEVKATVKPQTKEKVRTSSRKNVCDMSTSLKRESDNFNDSLVKKRRLRLSA